MDIIELTRNLAMEIQKDQRYQILDNARRLNDADEELQQQIGDFNLARMDLNAELSKSADKDQEKIAALNTKVNQMYNDIMSNESMAAYNEAKTELESVMNYVNAIINTAVNGGDPMTVEEPTQGCSGSCSSCSGCH